MDLTSGNLGGDFSYLTQPSNFSTGSIPIDQSTNFGLGPDMFGGLGDLTNPSGYTDPFATGMTGDPNLNALDNVGGMPQGSSMWDSITNGIGNFTNSVEGGLSSLFGNATGNSSYHFPFANLAGGLLGMLGSNQTENTLKGLFNQTLNADPWNSQMGRYQPLLYSAASQGIGNTPYGQSIMDSTARKMASMGYMNSGNMAPAIAQALNNGTTTYMNSVAPLAMGRMPNTIGAGYLGNAIGNMSAAKYNAAGYGLGQLLNGAARPAPVVQQQQSKGGNGLGQLIGTAAGAYFGGPVGASIGGTIGGSL